PAISAVGGTASWPAGTMPSAARARQSEDTAFPQGRTQNREARSDVAKPEVENAKSGPAAALANVIFSIMRSAREGAGRQIEDFQVFRRGNPMVAGGFSGALSGAGEPEEV